MEPLYQAGDVVLLKDSCQIDIGWWAWEYIRTHRKATVVSVISDATERSHMYTCEWPNEFDGGHDCMGKTARRCGQYVSEQHLELENFEASRVVNTVPNIGGYEDAEEVCQGRTDDIGEGSGPAGSVAGYSLPADTESGSVGT